MPKMEKIPSSTLGKPWYTRLRLYVTEPTKFKLSEDWKVSLPNDVRFMLPAGFPFDGASIPWFLRWLATSFGPLLRGALFHDGGYKNNYLLSWDGEKFATNKKQKYYDDLFRDIVIWTTGLKLLAYLAWSGVRTFGSISWNKHRKNDEKLPAQ